MQVHRPNVQKAAVKTMPKQEATGDEKAHFNVLCQPETTKQTGPFVHKKRPNGTRTLQSTVKQVVSANPVCVCVQYMSLKNTFGYAITIYLAMNVLQCHSCTSYIHKSMCSSNDGRSSQLTDCSLQKGQNNRARQNKRRASSGNLSLFFFFFSPNFLHLAFQLFHVNSVN